MTNSATYTMLTAAPTAAPTQTQLMPPTSIIAAPAPKIRIAPERWGSTATRPATTTRIKA